MTIPAVPRRILAAVDLSAPSLEALPAAQALARRFGASLHVVYVEPPPRLPPYEYDALDRAADDAIQEERRRFRRAWKRRMDEEGRGALVGFKASWLTGWPSVELRRMAGPEETDLLVIGAHGRKGVGRFLYGSMAGWLLRVARVPVLCVHAGAAPRLGPGHEVLAPYLLSDPDADRALKQAAELAAAARSPLTVLSVAPLSVPSRDVRAAVRARLAAALGEHAARKVRLVLRHGEKREQIAAESGRERYGLLVLSARLRRFSLDRLAGSTAERVLRLSRAPLLAVPAAPRGRKIVLI